MRLRQPTSSAPEQPFNDSGLLPNQHKTRSVFDRYHIVAGADQLEAVARLAELQGSTRTLPARSRASSGLPRPQVRDAQRWPLASPTVADSNRLTVWLRGWDSLRLGLGAVA